MRGATPLFAPYGAADALPATVGPVIAAAADDAPGTAELGSDRACASGPSPRGVPNPGRFGEVSTGSDTVGSPAGPIGSPIWSTPPVQAQASVVATDRTKAVGTAAMRTRRFRRGLRLTRSQYCDFNPFCLIPDADKSKQIAKI
ncbi:hypothetical protein Ari01nite_34460 [Paractinoplanes rishiriensis]|uniref:Uncharacterized protein n=1 Tax=Paractinoplanes rishiriensis TaxID=1050105 RepID=A0A919K3J8_9ACTN|nr:hypothetical protein Ari01nite_34460 [Actinoplanes rishiriensis]